MMKIFRVITLPVPTEDGEHGVLQTGLPQFGWAGHTNQWIFLATTEGKTEALVENRKPQLNELYMQDLF